MARTDYHGPDLSLIGLIGILLLLAACAAGVAIIRWFWMHLTF